MWTKDQLDLFSLVFPAKWRRAGRQSELPNCWTGGGVRARGEAGQEWGLCAGEGEPQGVRGGKLPDCGGASG